MKNLRILVVLLALAATASAAVLQQAVTQQLPADVAAYEKYRRWLGQQPREVSEGDPITLYRAKLLADGEPAAAVEEQVRIIREQGRRLEIERWNRILTSS